jgi:hypothetical protein
MFGVRTRPTNAHRVAYALEHGYLPAGVVVRHTCDNKNCVRPSHLVLGSQADNMADRSARGAPDLVREARALADTGLPLRHIAARIERSRRWTSAVIRNLKWHDPDYVPRPPSVSHVLSPQDIEMAFAAWREGQSVRSLAHQFQVGYATMYDQLHARINRAA